MKKFPEYKGLDLSGLASNMQEQWKNENIFEKSIKERGAAGKFIFFEGPPSANGMPGIHHVMARTIKDIVCRYKTQKGYSVNRKAGWDTHGLPVELGVEKRLQITKEDIGTKISIEDYNKTCRSDVMKFTSEWRKMTERMGYWVDLDNPYITYDNKYIETLWWMLSQLYKKGLLYKGFTIQPYSPAAGTGLSNHELNQPGCYRDVKDTTCTAQFKVANKDEYFLAWTTTPWTLPSNTALAVGPTIDYVKVKTENPYTKQPVTVILAEKRLEAVMQKLNYEVIDRMKGSDLKGIKYEQLIPWAKPDGKAFEVIVADYVTTEDGTGIVHIAPTFGADDKRVGDQNGIAGMWMINKNGKPEPMVDRQGRLFRIADMDPEYAQSHISEQYKSWAGKFVKNAYDPSKKEDDETLDIEICLMLKTTNRVFRIEKHTHNYPHCWRTDKPVLYYPLDSWFIRTTALRDRLMELNSTISWHPASTGEGRFGKWLESLVDWNLSRSRYWGTPLPIWADEEMDEVKCIGSVAELKMEIEKSVSAGLMDKNPLESFKEGDFSSENYNCFDLHRPFVDNIILVGSKGQELKRQTDLIDVWFDSGAMPYAQAHFPFEQDGDSIDDKVKNLAFPADFIAEGVDQTRGWFFTLHALATMLFDSVAFKNIISNGLVLDKNGNKMSKRLGNAVDPFEAMDSFGPDAVRWYMISNSQPWDNLKFDNDGVNEIRRKYFGTLYNTYSFFALYANVDGFTGEEALIPVKDREEIDRWIISLLNSLVKYVDAHIADYDLTPAARAIEEFVEDNLSNWYVRLNRKRFWGGGMTQSKLAAYQTLYECLVKVAQLSAPIAPFFSDRLYRDLTSNNQSVHLTDFPTYDLSLVNKDQEERMAMAQTVTSMALALRKKVSLKVRQPLAKIVIPVMDEHVKQQLKSVENLILSEINVKEIEYIDDVTGIITRKIKPNYKLLGATYGKQMKAIAAATAQFSQDDIADLVKTGQITIQIPEDVTLTVDKFEITSEDMPGWLVATEGAITISLDIQLSDDLIKEGIAREIVNRIQNIRKDNGFEITDKIFITFEKESTIISVTKDWGGYISSQVLAESISFSDEKQEFALDIEDINVTVSVSKAN